MDRKQKILIGLVAAAALVALVFLVKKLLKRDTGPRPIRVGKDSPCPDPQEMVMEDDYMRGIIDRGHKYTALVNYYACNPIKRGDFILYRFSPDMPPVVRIVRGIEGDKFSLRKDKERKAWNVIINGEVLMSRDIPHFFGTDAVLPPLGLAMSSRAKGLFPTDLIVFSSWAPGDYDSSVFGLIHVDDVIGKAEVIPGQYDKAVVQPPPPPPKAAPQAPAEPKKEVKATSDVKPAGSKPKSKKTKKSKSQTKVKED